MRYTTSKEVNELLERMERAGCTISRDGKHVKCRSPSGAIVVLAKSPSDHRAYLNIRSRLRHLAREHGLQVQL